MLLCFAPDSSAYLLSYCPSHWRCSIVLPAWLQAQSSPGTYIVTEQAFPCLAQSCQPWELAFWRPWISFQGGFSVRWVEIPEVAVIPLLIWQHFSRFFSFIVANKEFPFWLRVLCSAFFLMAKSKYLFPAYFSFSFRLQFWNLWIPPAKRCSTGMNWVGLFPSAFSRLLLKIELQQGGGRRGKGRQLYGAALFYIRVRHG